MTDFEIQTIMPPEYQFTNSDHCYWVILAAKKVSVHEF